MLEVKPFFFFTDVAFLSLAVQPDMDLRISDDAGRYLCDYIYYSSLAECRKQQRPGKVVFLHVPADASDRSVEQGREITQNLIRAIAESEVTARSKPE